MVLMPNMRPLLSVYQKTVTQRHLHVSAALNKVQAGRYKPTRKQDKPLTYEMANPPHYIAHRKSWNSWNTSNVLDGNRPSETTIEDIFIRRFMNGTWHAIFASEIIIKRQHNMIRIAGVITRNTRPRNIYFLTGYSEEFLSNWLHCPVKIELASIDSKEDIVYKYV